MTHRLSRDCFSRDSCCVRSLLAVGCAQPLDEVADRYGGPWSDGHGDTRLGIGALDRVGL